MSVTVIDNAVYVAGRRAASPPTLARTTAVLSEHGGFAWVGLYRPEAVQLNILAAQFDLHPLAVEDALLGHQRAKLERYGDTRFLVLRPARYLDESETVEFGEVELFVGKNFVIAIRQAESPDLAAVRERLEGTPDLLGRGPLGVLYAILDRVVDDYVPVIAGLQNDIDEIEAQLFSGDRAVTRRIYDLSGEVMEIQRAVRPLVGMIETLRGELETEYGDDPGALELRRSFRDVLDHVIGIVQLADEFRQTLQNALTVHATLVAQQQNETSLAQSEQTKRISSWAAIIFAPSLITGIYGMNFAHMPELESPWGYPLALVGMLAFAGALFAVFRSRNWL